MLFTETAAKHFTCNACVKTKTESIFKVDKFQIFFDKFNSRKVIYGQKGRIVCGDVRFVRAEFRVVELSPAVMVEV